MPYQNHYSRKEITEIDPKVDQKIRIIGFIVDKKNDTLIVDDGTAKARVFVDNPEQIEPFEINQLIAVFGLILPIENGEFEIKADILQDKTGLDINLCKEIDNLYKKIGV